MEAAAAGELLSLIVKLLGTIVPILMAEQYGEQRVEQIQAKADAAALAKVADVDAAEKKQTLEQKEAYGTAHGLDRD